MYGSITLLATGIFRFAIWPLHFSQLPSSILWPVGSYGSDFGLEFYVLDICTSQDSGYYSATRESMLSQKWPPDHQHPIGSLGIETLRWGRGGTADTLIYTCPSIFCVPSCRLWAILQLGPAQQAPRISCPLLCHVHFTLSWSFLLLSSPSNATSQGISDALTTTLKNVWSLLCLMTQFSRAMTGHAIPPHLPVSIASLAWHEGECNRYSENFHDLPKEELWLVGSTWVGCWSEPITSPPWETCARWGCLSLPQCIVGSISDISYPDLVCHQLWMDTELTGSSHFTPAFTEGTRGMLC